MSLCRIRLAAGALLSMQCTNTATIKAACSTKRTPLPLAERGLPPMVMSLVPPPRPLRACIQAEPSSQMLQRTLQSPSARDHQLEFRDMPQCAPCHPARPVHRWDIPQAGVWRGPLEPVNVPSHAAGLAGAGRPCAGNPANGSHWMTTWRNGLNRRGRTWSRAMGPPAYPAPRFNVS